MLNSTLKYLKCPTRNGQCSGELALRATHQKALGHAGCFETTFGEITCAKCNKSYPILAGVAVLVPDVRGYLLAHVKGVSQWVSDHEIPSSYRNEFLQAKEEIETEHIEEDLESERVNALYMMNHYLPSAGSQAWWAPQMGEGSPLIENLVRQYWDSGPFAKIREYLDQRANEPSVDFLELGCGVGGLLGKLGSHVKTYLGVDSSFASIALARQLLLGISDRNKLMIPEDLLNGPVSREVTLPLPESTQNLGKADYLVCDVEHPPLKPGQWDMTASLNMIDMLDSPGQLPKLQAKLLRKGGKAIQSCPYIWHPQVARKLRKTVPKTVQTSSQAVEWLYQQAGFHIEKTISHLPWLFFKHVRQLEVYSVHLFFASKVKDQ